MKLSDKYIYLLFYYFFYFYFFSTGDKVRKTCLQNHPSLILKLPLIQLHFAKTTLGFSLIIKISFLCAFKFLKALLKHTQSLH
jgi:hypothetical protein